LSEPRACINAALAVARQAEPSAQPDVLAALDRIPVESLNKDTLLDLIRAHELAFIRLGEPTERVKQQVAKKFAPLFPAGHQATNHTQPSNQLHGGSGRTHRQNLQLVKN